MKRCARCKQGKPRSEFYRDRSQSNGLSSYCKVCAAERQREWRAKNHDRFLEAERARNPYKRAWERENALPCPDCGGAVSNPYSERCWDCVKAARQQAGRERTARWLEMRHAGMDNREIADREGVPYYVIATALQRSRVARYPELAYVRAPYMNGQRKPKVRHE